MDNSTYFTYQTSAGKFTIASDGNAITHIVPGIAAFPGKRCATYATNEAANQLQEYLGGKRRSFDFPLQLSGSGFQKKVWEACMRIPYGQTVTYGQIASRIGNPRSARAVGLALKRNPVVIAVPCHRVVGSSGKVGGYAYGMKMKNLLLSLEQGQSKQ